ncbi:MAG: hypothetical protein ACR2HG_06775 [Pyrinomonadaceae bacterium]
MNDSNDFSIEKCEALAQTYFQNIQLVYEFAENHKHTIMSVISKPDTNYRDDCIKGLWSRIYFWLYSLSRLNATRDFQAFGSANRAILEITIDLVLLHQDKSNSSGWKMYWWSRSEKLQGAEQVIKFFIEANIDIPNIYTEQQNFIKREQPMISHMRKMLWNGKHPKRWTGNRYLSEDVKNADVFWGGKFLEVLNKTLLEYFQTEYKKMNWYVHSGVASFWDLPKESFPIISAFFLKGCSDFASLSTQIVIKDFGLSEHLPNYKQELEKLEFESLESYIRNMEMRFSEDLVNHSK